MDRRVFLGWDGPLAERVVDWLWARRESMPGMLVVVPTAQSGRRLREALAERGPCLAPRVVTPGWWLRVADAAPESAERVAWVEALEAVADWSEFSALFPGSPAGEAGWSLVLARAFVALEGGLQEAAMTPVEAARRLAGSPEGERWAELGALWRRKESLLQRWGLTGRSSGLARAIDELPEGEVVLAGVPDLPAAVVGRISRLAELTVLVAAPPEEAEAFDEWGRPREEAWSDRALAWPEDGAVTLCADPRQQAAQAVARVAAAGTGSADLALGTADEEVGDELLRAFGRAGWTLHNPAARGTAGARGWWSAWRAWMVEPTLARAIDLLGFAASSRLVGGLRAQRVRDLSRLRDAWLARHAGDLAQLEALERRDPQSLERARETIDWLERWRARFQREPFAVAVGAMLDRIDAGGDEVRDWLASMEVVMAALRRDAVFWLELMAPALPDLEPEPPAGRVADVQGWLELLHEPGAHLVLCGMNEGRVPGGVSADPWLAEPVRERLGLSCDRSRAARDAYLLRALLEMRRGGGRVDLLLGKSSAGGDALLPSRLLLASQGGELARRVGVLFAGVEPPDAGLRWQRDWSWRMPEVTERERLSVTALRDFLACPLRFTLKHRAGMVRPEPERMEWNARDFGNVLHEVLERWGRDEEARDFSKAEALADWLDDEFGRVLAARFEGTPPLAVRIQAEGARQRLRWFARVQACERAAGWRVVEVEKKFAEPFAGVTLVGTADRIDRHDDGRRRVLDYKTYGSFRKVEPDHRKALRSNSVPPAHLEGVDEVLARDARGKAVRWSNLQVPLYSAFLGEVDELGYFLLGESEANVALSFWEDFTAEDRDSALRCAEWVIGRIREGVDGPPAEKVKYDDFALLACGRGLGEMFATDREQGR